MTRKCYSAAGVLFPKARKRTGRAESGPGKQLANDHAIVEKLANEVAEFITRVERQTLSGESADQLAKMLRAEQHLLTCADHAHMVAMAQAELEPVEDEQLLASLATYRASVVQFMESATPVAKGFSMSEREEKLDAVQTAYDDVKTVLLRAGAELCTPIPGMIEILDQNSSIRRMTRQMAKAIRLLDELYVVADVQLPESKEAIPL